MTTKNQASKSQSYENYGVLVDLKNSMEGVATRLDHFAAQQLKENANLHDRITNYA